MIVEKNIKLYSNGRTFLADYYSVDKASAKPLVIFCHGYKGYKDWGAWQLMASSIASAGFNFVIFNFSHNGTTPQYPSAFVDLEAFGHNNYSLEQEDLEVVINHFSNQDNQQIFLIGHSRGGGTVMIKANENKNINGIITLAGVCDYIGRMPTGELLRKWQKDGVRYVENKRTKQLMPHYYQFYEDLLKNRNRFDLMSISHKINIPWLIIHGTNDESVNPQEAVKLHQSSSHAELLLIENAGHTFGATEPWDDEVMPEHLEKATQACIKFLDKNTNNNML